MAGKRRTRPGGGWPKQPDQRIEALAPLNSPYPGCCTPYPDARFRNQVLVELNAHHQGPQCKGFLEPMDVEEFIADVDARASGSDGGDVR